jgi:hypothetical protein
MSDNDEERGEEFEDAEEEVEIFELAEWGRQSRLTDQTTTKLEAEDLITKQCLAMLTEEDIRSLQLTLGQTKLLTAAVEELKAEDAAPVTTNEAADADGHHGEPVSLAQATIKDVRRHGQAATLTQAGKTFDQLYTHTSPSSASGGATSSQAATTFDPRSTLTVKASRAKALHITQFLSEKTKKRRQGRRKELVLATSSDTGDRLVVKAEDDHPYSGILIHEWAAGNCKLLNQLLQSGELARQDIEYYLAYTNKICEFADRYEWESILDYDHTYRELQAESQFAWGTISPHMELQLLTPRQRAPPGGRPRTQPWGPRGGSQQPDCIQFKTNGTCRYGADCKYRHVSGPPEKTGSKNGSYPPRH